MDTKADMPLEFRTRSKAAVRSNEGGNNLPAMNNIRREVVQMSPESATLKLNNSTGGVD